MYASGSGPIARHDSVRVEFESTRAAPTRLVASLTQPRFNFRWLNEHLGGPFTDWRLCPHQDGEGCACRKPRPGMFLDLASAHKVDLGASVHVGDSDKDRQAATAAGIPTFHWAWDFFNGPVKPVA